MINNYIDMNEKIIEKAIENTPQLSEALQDLIAALQIDKWFVLCIVILVFLAIYARLIVTTIIVQINKNREADAQKIKAEADKLREKNYQRMLEDNQKAVEIIENENEKYKGEAEYWRMFALNISEKFQYSISLDKLDIIIDYTLGLRASFSNELKSRIMGLIERGMLEDSYKLYNEIYELFSTKIIETIKIFMFPDRQLYEKVENECKIVIDCFLDKLIKIIKDGCVEEKLDTFLISGDGIRETISKIKSILKENYSDKVYHNGFTNFLRKK